MARSFDPAQEVTSQAASASAARAVAFGRAERHSRRVRRLKVILPFLAVGLAALFAGIYLVNRPAPVEVASVEDQAFSEGKLVMSNPKLEGFTRDGRPYTMTAVRAVQETGMQGLISLEQIDARMPVDVGQWAQVRAKLGVYDRAANTLKLTDDIKVNTEDGMSAQLTSAFLDITSGRLTSSEPVDIRLRGAGITAEAMEMLDNGKRLVFDRRVRMNIDPSTASLPRQTSGEPNASN
ncbi:MAG: LPS export ABC transporter periplasmic protein LptC [Rhizobiaceae bacterium]